MHVLFPCPVGSCSTRNREGTATQSCLHQSEHGLRSRPVFRKGGIATLVMAVTSLGWTGSAPQLQGMWCWRNWASPWITWRSVLWRYRGNRECALRSARNTIAAGLKK